MNAEPHFCRIVEEGVFLNGKQWMTFDEKEGSVEKLTALYKKIGLTYPKFHKMDLLSKASILGTELLKKKCPAIATSENDYIGLLFSNSETSSETDRQFLASYQENHLPSPSLFVYTLPNIAMGEVAIRNKWYGAQMFGVFPNFAPDYFADYGSLMLADGSRYVVGGWIDIKHPLDVLLFVFDRETGADKGAFVRRLEEMYKIGR